MGEVEFAVPLVDQLRDLTPEERDRAVAGLRCARCKQHAVSPEARVCPECVVELRAGT